MRNSSPVEENGYVLIPLAASWHQHQTNISKIIIDSAALLIILIRLCSEQVTAEPEMYPEAFQTLSAESQKQHSDVSTCQMCKYSWQCRGITESHFVSVIAL